MAMFRVESQWVYAVTDTNSMDFDMSPFINMAHDGYNLAFLFNTSYAQESILCPSGLVCLATEIAEVLAVGFEKTLQEELKTFQEVLIDAKLVCFLITILCRFHSKNGK